ncbi:hypothetical protein PTHTG4_27370 [Parageobacillus thermoglucosidasius]|uniref:head-tail connector protein n=1 Tax=Parageobacillus thermoglucosidasius TaxID=1426 RepID=UPI000F621615|nr:head-tail connector protein [Parageobacillus thermoglucosidasius]GCD83673.1 hypothetical protein PTHTG4_27370 [Parageobacillus thermoglucosidasius]
MSYRLIEPPTSEPVSLQEVKNYLRIDHTEEDTFVQSLIVASRQYIEQLTRRSIAVQTWELTLDSFPNDEILIPLPPLKTINSITYMKNGMQQTLTTYEMDNVSEPARLKGDWPDTDNVMNAVKIEFIAGYDTCPEPLRQAMLLLISHWYENREIVSFNGALNNIPFTVDALVSQYKIWRFI